MVSTPRRAIERRASNYTRRRVRKGQSGHTKTMPIKRVRLDSEERRRRILDAATQLFLRNGFEGTSLNEVIRLAGGSKQSLFEHFEHKTGLFAAVIELPVLDLRMRLPGDELRGEPRQILQHFGEVILRFFLRPASLLVCRGVIAQGHRYPQMARAFHLRGTEQVIAPIIDKLKTWHQEGRLMDMDYHAEADRFIHLLRSGVYEEALLGFRRRVTAQEITSHVTGAVRLFIRGLERERTPPCSARTF